MRLKQCFALIGLALALALSLPAQTVRVLVVTGAAEIIPAGETAARPIVKGDAVTAGSVITTGADGRVVLTPMPGVKSIIAPNSSLKLESVSEKKNADATTAYGAVIDLKVGAVVSDLNKPADVTYDYSVRTPRGLAGARGTTFTVGVNPAGIATIVVAHGTISLTFNDGRPPAAITPGKVSITRPDGTTVEANKVSDLSPEDQKIAANWTEITLKAIAEAIANGVELAPETLQNVLDTAKGLGVETSDTTKPKVELSDEAKAQLKLIEQILQLHAEQKQTEKNSDAEEEGTEESSTDNIADIIAAFRSTLNIEQQYFFDLLTPTQQGMLATANNAALTDYVLANYDNASAVDYSLALNATQRTKFLGLDTSTQNLLISENNSQFTSYALVTGRTLGEINYFAALDSTQRTNFLSLSLTEQNLLVSSDDSQLTAYALTTGRTAAQINYFAALDATQRTNFLALDSTSQGQLVSADDSGLTSYVLATGRTTEEIAFVLALNSPKRSLYLGLDSMTQALLVTENNAQFTNYVLSTGRTAEEITYFSSLEATQRTAFLTLTSEQQSTLVSSNDPLLTAYILATERTSAERAYAFALDSAYLTIFLGLDASSQEFLAETNDSELTDFALGSAVTPPYEQIRFFANLTSTQRPVFIKLTDTNRNLLIAINDTTITNVALGGDPRTGVNFTNVDLGVNLTAISNLSPVALTFLKEAGGTNLEFGPGPGDWSATAFERSAASWNALSPDDKTFLLNQRATEAVMDRSATFISAFIAGIYNEIGTTGVGAIQQAGWGYVLFESYYQDDNIIDQAVTIAASLTSAQRALIQSLDLEPYDFLYNEGGLSYIMAQLDSLSALSSGQLDIIRKLDLGGDLLYYDVTTITSALDRIGMLGTAEQKAVVELGLGSYYLTPGSDIVYLDSGGTTTTNDRLNSIIATYLGFTAEQKEALRNTHLIDSETLLYNYNGLGTSYLDSADLTTLVNDFLALPARTQGVISQSHEYTLLDLLGGGGESQYRTLGDFATLVAALSDSELETLRDMGGDDILFRGLVYDQDPLGTLQSAISFYSGLGTLQKFTLRELGIIQQYGMEWLTVNQAGLSRLLTVYSELSGETRAGTEFVSSTSEFTTINDDSIFVTRNYGEIVNVSFVTSSSELHIGSVKQLVITGANSSESATFIAGTNNDGQLFLNASDLVDLDSVSFGTNIRSITIEAATINLANLTFQAGTNVNLKSLYGVANFDGTSHYGKVNFLHDVYYDTTKIDSQGVLDSLSSVINIGTLDGMPAQTPQ